MQTQSGPESEPALRLRITHILSSMAGPLPSLRASYVPSTLPSAIPTGLIPHQLPIIRIFGTTPSHQKICANIHLAYPYFYVPFPMDSTNPLRPERVIGICQRFAVSLNHAICLALRQNPTGASTAANFAGGTDPKHLHVISVLLVKGIPFYGYHVGYSYFLKVSLANPARVRIATEQLRKPVVLGREWQPHEAHLSHVLQFMCDFDLYGCGTLDLSGGTFREPLPEGHASECSHPDGIINALTVPSHMLYPSGLSPPKDTYTDIEIDVLPHQIMNRNRLTERPLHHDFIELLHAPLDPEEKLVPAMKELWEDERRRRAAKGLGTSELEMLPVSGGGRGRSMEELGYKVDAQEVNNRGGDWKISEELWGIIEARMAAERARRGRLTFERFTGDLRNGKNGEKQKYDRWVMTTFEAVAAHWPKQHRTQRTQKSQASVKLSSPVKPSHVPASSSTPLPSSPVAEDDEENPFEFTSQASQGERVEAEVNAYAIQLATDKDEEDRDEDEESAAKRQHEEVTRLRAEEGERFRATQKAPEEDLDDDDLDELFLRTVGGAETPTKARSVRSETPSTAGTMSTGRRKEKLQRRVEAAGFGDLGDIAEMSSFTLSSPSTANPFADPQTPTKKRGSTAVTPTSLGRSGRSDASTPASLVRNIFSRPRDSPLNTPTKQTPRSSATTPRANVVFLPQPQRSVSKLSLSPAELSPFETKPARHHSPTPKSNLEPVLLEIHAKPAPEPPAPNAQQIPPTPMPSKRPHDTIVLSATVTNTPQLSPTLPSSAPASAAATAAATAPSSNGPPKKRVRLESPPPPPPSLPAAPSFSSSGGSATSAPARSDNSSTVPGPVNGWTFAKPPPSVRDVLDTMVQYGLDSVEYHEPFYSDPADVPPRPKLFAGRAFRVGTNSVEGLPDFEHEVEVSTKSWLKRKHFGPVRVRHGWEYAHPPPSLREVVKFCETEDAAVAASQLAVPTQKNRYGFKLSQKKPQREQQNMSVLLLEVFAPSRLQLLPDPEKDPIAAVFFCFQNDRDDLPDTTRHPGYHAGYVVIESPQVENRRARLDGIPCHYVEGELDLINWVIDAVKDWDPDVLAGWELHNASWGYLAARAHQAFGTSLTQDLSRLITSEFSRRDAYSEHHTSLFKVTGRHVLNIWRILRSEVTLLGYTFENVVFHVLHQRIPHYTAANLTALWKSKTPEHTARVLKVFFQRVVLYAELIDAAEIISKNAEFARVFGVDFDAVIFRGSQFKVESFMFRIAKPESFVMVSPSKQQVGLQNAPFAVPLIAEPESKYYPHPIVVLDFQSLYPSVMIAYNICFSTCLGRVEKFKGTDKFGFTELKVADGLLELLKDYLTVTPNGMIFVKPAVRKSLLAKMLGEILDTRVMVKNAMKHVRGDKSLTQMLNARQLGLKLMANVTYGYTSATYSGRMPCIEIADSIVQTGRETLEKAQELIHSRDDWGATVVYGDTDSLFIALPGRSKEQAFKIGHDIADTVTAMNPKPVKLKFEKVYMGSVLMAKKRYVGFKYEHPDDEPVFDAKGIETIRRDGFPAQQKIEEVCLKMLFRTQDLSAIKEFCRQEWTKILQGRVSIQDFIIAKEVRLGTYSEKGVPPPGAAVAYRRILKDPRDEPQYAERVPYIISNAQGRRLIDRARMPEEILANPTLGIDAEYYIRNLLIPPLSRIFNLVGADVEAWYESMPRTKRAGRYAGASGTRIDAHFRSSHCRVCGGASDGDVCAECVEQPDTTVHALVARQQLAHARLADLHRICASCSGTPAAEPVLCRSIDCPVTYARVAAEKDAAEAGEAASLISKLDW